MLKDELYYRPFNVANKAEGSSIVFQVFRGNIGIAVFGKGGGKPVFNLSLNPFKYIMFKTLLKKIKEASPETKIPLKNEIFDTATKQYKLQSVLTLQKDAKQCYHILITNCITNVSFDFVLRGTSGVSIGADPMSEAARSAVHLEVLVDWLDNAHRNAFFSDEKFVPNGGGHGGNYQGGGNSNGGASSGGYGDEIPF